jgi:hypothetical protein
MAITRFNVDVLARIEVRAWLVWPSPAFRLAVELAENREQHHFFSVRPGVHGYM